MTLTEPMLEKLVTPKQGGHMTTRLPVKCAQTNAALIAAVKAERNAKEDRARRSIERLQGGAQ